MIFNRQLEKLISLESLKKMLLGRVPSIDDIQAKIQKIVGDGKITYKYLPHPPRSKFNNELFNQQLVQIGFDLGILYDEVVDLFSNNTQRFQFANLFHSVHSSELDRLGSELDLLLFTIDNADFYFAGAYDDFSSTNKLDFNASTPNVIQLSEKVLALPFGGIATQRVPTPHLLNQSTWQIDILSPDTTKVISSQFRADFSNMFSDLTQPWLYEIITNDQVPVEIRFRFPLAGLAADEIQVLVNRFEVRPASVTDQVLTIRVSNDNINYKTLLGYESGLTIKDQKTTYAMDFETNLVQYIEIGIKKTTPDEEVGQEGQQKTYRYLFGLASFAAFTTGRVPTARYQSTAFDFSSENNPISRVILKADNEVPTGTTVQFSIAAQDADGNDLSGFQPINPGEVIQLGNLQQKTKRIYQQATSPYGTVFKGKQLYMIGDPLSDDPIFGSATLLRGFGAWYRDTSQAFNIVDIQDNYISFATTDIENLYAVTTEVPLVQNSQALGPRSIILIVDNKILYNRDRGHLLTPATEEQGSGVDLTPNYAIYRVLQSGPRSRVTKTFQIRARTADLPATNFLLISPDVSQLPTIVQLSTTTLINGTDFTFEVDSTGGVSRPTGRIIIPDGSSLIDSQGNILHPDYNYDFTYTLDPDVTHKVVSITDNTIVLDNTVVDISTDTFEVRYRFAPIAPNELIKASVIVKSAASTSNTQIIRYQEGTDYSLDPRTCAIQRIATGRIPSTGSVFIDFKYRSAEEGIETFTTWAFVRDLNQIRFALEPDTQKNTLVADSRVGERFLLNSPSGLIDLTAALSTPTLPTGWVQFIVRSKDPDAHTTFGTNLIDQIIQLRDISNRRIFKENGNYFTSILALRDPMVQVTLNQLKVNTLPGNKTNFAIDDITTPGQNIIVVPFAPNRADDLYLRIPAPDNSPDDQPPLFEEVYELDWSAQLESRSIASKIVVRVDLARDQSLDGGITPKVHSYAIKTSF